MTVWPGRHLLSLVSYPLDFTVQVFLPPGLGNFTPLSASVTHHISNEALQKERQCGFNLCARRHLKMTLALAALYAPETNTHCENMHIPDTAEGGRDHYAWDVLPKAMNN